MIGAGLYERTEFRTAPRNGFRPRTLTTTAGDLELRIPKLRAGSFFPSLLERRRRIDQALFALWESVTDKYELTVAEELLPTEAARVADRLDAIAAEAATAPLTVRNARGDQVANPLLTEARQQSIVLSRLIPSLRMPEDDAEDDRGHVSRPQRRGVSRGAYRPRVIDGGAA